MAEQESGGGGSRGLPDLFLTVKSSTRTFQDRRG
jgi:hypothetical protein